MDRAAFEGLEVLRRERAAGVGDAELCRRGDGETVVRLRVLDGACQRACLDGGLPPNARLERGVLELLYPVAAGVSLKEWLFTQEPNLGVRREACLALVAQCLADRAPPCVLALSARVEDLRFSERGAGLIYLADWGRWTGEADAERSVQAVAGLCGAILTQDLPRGCALPVELELLRRRVEAGGYVRWEPLHRDLAALPDDVLSVKQRGERLLRGAARAGARLYKPAFCLVTAGALLLALLSLASAASRQRRDLDGDWSPMTAVAGESWGETP